MYEIISTLSPQLDATKLAKRMHTKISGLQCFSFALHCVSIGFFSQLLNEQLLQ